MAWFKREEGEPIKGLSSLRRFIPHLMPGRNQAAVYYDQKIEVSRLLAWLDAHNEGKPDDQKVHFFHAVLCAFVRTLAARPRLNRFISGRETYQRNNIALSFAVKRAFHDDADLATVKIAFEPDDTLDEVARKAYAAVASGRSEARSTSQKELDVVAALPKPLLRAVMGLQRCLDGLNLLPAVMVREDPLYASVFLANLGSIGLDAPFHHLYEYGTVPLFAVIGRISKEPIVDANGALAVGQVVHLRYTLDERIADGFYCARSLELLRELLEDPERLAHLASP